MRPVRKVLSKSSMTILGIPVNMQDKTIEDFHTFGKDSLKEVKSFIQDYLFRFSDRVQNCEGLFLYGSNGVGKTFIACILVKEAYKYRFTTKRVTFSQYINLYTEVWDAKGVEQRALYEDALYQNAKSVEFLVLEEVGKEIDTKIGAPILEDLLRYREDHGLTTVICANLSPKDIEERYGESIFSLMQGNMIPVLIEGKDERRHFFNERKSEQ